MNMIRLSKVATGIAVFCVCLPIFAQSSPDVVVGTVANPLGAEFEQLAKVTVKQGRVVLYRASGSGAGAASVFINGGYQSSLVHGGYSQICLSPSQVNIGVRLVENGRDVRRDFDSVEQISVPGGKNVYIRVVDRDNGTAGLKVVSEDLALSELKSTRQQIHTVSRVRGAANCELDLDAPKAAPMLVALEKEIPLAADSMFAFGKSDLQSMLPEGRAALKTLAERISATYKNQDRLAVQIVGHADPFNRSGDAVNTRLSLERAKTVGEYFVANGFKPNQIITDGKGASEPVITSCGTTRTQANFDCNKPNRRVVVTVGTRTL